jgi:hypothetical protein
MDPRESHFLNILIHKNDSELKYMLSNKDNVQYEAYLTAKYILEERANSVDYSKYNHIEIAEALNGIKKEEYPVRYHILKKEADKRKIHSDIESVLDLETFISEIRINPDIKIQSQNFKTNELEELELKRLPELFKGPDRYKYFSIEDSSIRLVFDYNLNRYEYGFTFLYRDKITNRDYESILHGVNNYHASEFALEFIKKGKDGLDFVEWKEADSKGIRLTKLTFYGILSALFLYLDYFIDNKSSFQASDQSNFFLEFLLKNQKNIFYVLGGALIFFIIRDRKQIISFNKLTGFEKFDTGMMIFIVIILFTVLFL